MEQEQIYDLLAPFGFSAHQLEGFSSYPLGVVEYAVACFNSDKNQGKVLFPYQWLKKVCDAKVLDYVETKTSTKAPPGPRRELSKEEYYRAVPHLLKPKQNDDCRVSVETLEIDLSPAVKAKWKAALSTKASIFAMRNLGYEPPPCFREMAKKILAESEDVQLKDIPKRKSNGVFRSMYQKQQDAAREEAEIQRQALEDYKKSVLAGTKTSSPLSSIQVEVVVPPLVATHPPLRLSGSSDSASFVGQAPTESYTGHDPESQVWYKDIEIPQEEIPNLKIY